MNVRKIKEFNKAVIKEDLASVGVADATINAILVTRNTNLINALYSKGPHSYTGANGRKVDYTGYTINADFINASGADIVDIVKADKYNVPTKDYTPSV